MHMLFFVCMRMFFSIYMRILVSTLKRKGNIVSLLGVHAMSWNCQSTRNGHIPNRTHISVPE
jgi:hypothetical protein